MPRIRLTLASTLVGALTMGAFAAAVSPAPAPVDLGVDLVTAADLGYAYTPRLVEVDAPSLDVRNAVLALGLDTTEHASHDYIEIILTSQAEEDLLRQAGFDFTVTIADLVLDEALGQQRDREWAARVGISDLPSGRTSYRSLTDFHDDIDALVAGNPELVKRISLGQSVEGLDLAGIEIGRDVNAPEDGRPVFLMFGVHHAREWPSAELSMEFAFDLVQGYTDASHDNHARIVDVLDRARVIVVPVSNPDGFNVSRTFADLITDNSNSPAWLRKNCRLVDGVNTPEGSCMLPYSAGQTGLGVDLNRNYGGLWGGPGADNLPASGTYHGPAPFSEPETQAIRALISTRQVTTLITNHTRGRLILRPNGVSPNTVGPDGHARGFAPDECFTRADGVDFGLQALGERMAAQVAYSNQFGWELYDTTGTTEDYSYNATGGYGYTFELMPSSGSFHPDYAQVVAEYTGEFSAAQELRSFEGRNSADGVASELTTPGGDWCEGDFQSHTNLGRGLRESYLIALENAADRRTHSVITGTAPAGAEITVTRTGEFPLWDGSFVEDTVTTTMVTTADGVFTYDVNPSTRPFVDARKLPSGDFTERTEEAWTVFCTVDGQQSASIQVVVDRGESVDVGAICA